MSWEDKGKLLYAGFAEDKRVVISESKDSVVVELDVLSGKGDGLKSDAFISAGKQPGIFLYVAGDSLAKLPIKDDNAAQLIQQINRGWLTLGEKDKNLVLQATLNTNNEQTATKIKQSLDGLRALLSLAAGDNSTDPKLHDLNDALSTLTITRDGSDVKLNWNMALDAIKDIIEYTIDEKNAEKPKNQDYNVTNLNRPVACIHNQINTKPQPTSIWQR